MRSSELEPHAASFACARCGARAASIWLEILPEGPAIRRESFTGLLTAPLAEATAVRLRAALDLGEAAVFDLDPEYAPFYCPDCRASYCGDHWDRQDVFDDDLPEWHDSIRGRCPNGHERMLED
jgi:hypothetical protein